MENEVSLENLAILVLSKMKFYVIVAKKVAWKRKLQDRIFIENL